MIHHRGLLSGWVTVKRNGVIHAVPNDDIKIHTIVQGMGCACEPELWQQEDIPVVIHRSYDGRELVEPLTSVLS